jgi:hypothetical protein
VLESVSTAGRAGLIVVEGRDAQADGTRQEETTLTDGARGAKQVEARVIATARSSRSVLQSQPAAALIRACQSPRR